MKLPFSRGGRLASPDGLAAAAAAAWTALRLGIDILASVSVTQTSNTLENAVTSKDILQTMLKNKLR